MRPMFNASAITPILDEIFSHYNKLFQMKREAAQIDIFNIIHGCWMPHTARCIMWMGGFRPSDVIELIMNHVEMLNGQKSKFDNLKEQFLNEEGEISKEFEDLQRNIATSLTGQDFVNKGDECAMTNFASHMSSLTGKFTIFLDLMEKGDRLREKTLKEIRSILKEKQQAASMLTLSDYFNRLVALTNLWETRHKTI
ncbi:transcription factor TGA2.3-like [Rutidosis leptorrhynchoides]|uniref:transcription factor TGA2.3-like n=1 Tax=Rutidosis leptorrhynchoides TaxID=125765 RepID=UPI003A99AB32